MKTITLSSFLALMACLPAAAATLTPGATGDAEVAAAVSGRVNVALASAGSVAFSSSDLGPNYSSPDVNDGIIDHTGFSWIPATANVNEFVGIRFAAPSSVGAVVWHGQTGYNGRSGATYSLEYSTDANPGAGSTWTAIGSYTYTEAGCATPMPRSFFAFTPVANVTGIRLLLTAIGCAIQPAVQELEVYAPSTLSPSATGDSAVAGAIAGRPNLGLASAGGVAFSSSDLGPNYAAPDVNDGVIDHTGFSWIPVDAAAGQFVGVAFATPAEVDSVVWHGQTGYNGRSAASYSLEYSKDLNPNGSSSWIAIGNYTYTEAGCASPMPRSLFSFAPIPNVTGVRLVINSVTCTIQPAVQELEAYGPLVNPPIITGQPQGGTFVEGDVITLTVTADGGTAFQWRKNGQPISGATSSTYVIPNATPNDAGSYTVRVANAAGNLISDPAVVVVEAAPVFATYTEAVLAANPIHYYPLDEISGTVAADLGSLATGGGTYSGGITLGQGSATTRLGRAARFDGAPGTFVDLGLFHVGDTLTVEAWANLDTSAGNNTFHAIVARWDGSYELDFATTELANLVVRNNNNTFGLVAGATPSARAQWHHVVGVFAGGVMTIYVDGVKGAESDIGGTLQDAGPSPDRVLIGATRSGTAASFNFRGLIDEVAIYDTALTAAQIRGHFRAAQGPGGPTLTIQPAVLLSWPSFPPNYILESAPKIEGPYAPYTESAPVIDDGVKKVTVPVGTEHKFFRLFQQ